MLTLSPVPSPWLYMVSSAQSFPEPLRKPGCSQDPNCEDTIVSVILGRAGAFQNRPLLPQVAPHDSHLLEDTSSCDVHGPLPLSVASINDSLEDSKVTQGHFQDLLIKYQCLTTCSL